MNIADKIKGSEKLTALFGEWPSFHDAEVLTFALDRNGPTIRVAIDVFAMTAEVDPQGYYVLKNRSISTLRFDGVEDFSANGFNHQNVLFDVLIEDISDRQLESAKFDVTFEDSHGLEAYFLCEAIEVESVIPTPPQS